MMEVEEAKRRSREAYDLGKREAAAELSADLRMLAQMFAEEVRALRQELREALGLPPMSECTCDRDRELPVGGAERLASFAGASVWKLARLGVPAPLIWRDRV